MPALRPQSETAKGLCAAAAAFGAWGVIPVYWKAVASVPAEEMVAWRVLFAVPFLALFLHLRGAWRHVRATLARPRILAVLVGTAALIAFNWFLFIHAMTTEQVMQASLGYYINPLLNVLLGFVLLGERMRRRQVLAVCLAAAGVSVLVVQAGEVPVVALLLALSFGLYGLLRKLVPVDALPGLFFEVMLLVPVATGWILWQGLAGGLAPADPPTWALVALAGLITALPLVWFAYGARRLPLATVGLLQFLAPTGHFLLAVLAYDEPFDRTRAATFVLIWAGVALYLLDLRRRRPPPPGPVVPAPRG